MKPTLINPVRELPKLLRFMRPELSSKRYAFASLPPEADLSTVSPLCCFAEQEGVSVIVEYAQAIAANIPCHRQIYRMIVLTVYSDLNSVGFLAAISQALANEDVPCNVVSAHFHDYLFVPDELANNAIQCLENLSKSIRFADT
ncbi:ACT domain-containing protein [Pandoraea vervacti]|uniref:ACT domain-containing protein n=1 Tax=Pandoraea vervacti TaxID=656178 RepID=UPI000AEF7A1E|nr:ACT domain-containing protein [Pandoraea vervacti]